MPQDVPLEASDLLPFTPASLEHMGKAKPVFMLRPATHREKKFHRRLLREEGIVSHSAEDIREEMLNGLEHLWSAEQYAAHAPLLRDYWTALDDFALQQKDDPDLKWEYDPEIERACDELARSLQRKWPPVARMVADNSEVGDSTMEFYVAVIVAGWTGIDLPLTLDRDYLDLDCLHKLHEKLIKLQRDNPPKGAKRVPTPGLAWQELCIACSARTVLDEEEAKNFVSPSPSSEAPYPSSDSSENGTSRASASTDASQSTSTNPEKSLSPTPESGSETNTGSSSASTANATGE